MTGRLVAKANTRPKVRVPRFTVKNDWPRALPTARASTTLPLLSRTISMPTILGAEEVSLWATRLVTSRDSEGEAPADPPVENTAEASTAAD